MKKRHYLSMLAVGTAMFFTSIPLNASLLITPLQIVMENRIHSTEVVLINPSQNTNTYRIHWLQLKQIQDAGGYVPVSDAEREQNLDLEDFTVFTPRQVTLKPNEKQTVRIAVRRPSDLPDGEYKSHLRFMIVPELSTRDKEKKEVGPNERGFGAQVYASYSIPIVYRAGEIDTQIGLGQPSFSMNEKTATVLVDLPVTRQGMHGVIGQIDIFYKPNGEEEYLIASHGNANLFPEITKRDFRILTQEKNLRPGQMRIVFIRAAETKSKGTVLAEKVFTVG